MKPTLVFPTILIALDVGAAVRTQENSPEEKSVW